MRYWTHVMDMPRAIVEAIESDVQSLVWDKSVTFEPDEFGNPDSKFRRWMKDKAQHGNRRRELGLGVLAWSDHVKAIQTKELLKYRDGTRHAERAGTHTRTCSIWRRAESSLFSQPTRD